MFGRGATKAINHVTGFCDSDYAGDLDRGRSFTTYILTLRGSFISWRATLPSTIALSTI